MTSHVSDTGLGVVRFKQERSTASVQVFGDMSLMLVVNGESIALHEEDLAALLSMVRDRVV